MKAVITNITNHTIKSLYSGGIQKQDKHVTKAVKSVQFQLGQIVTSIRKYKEDLENVINIKLKQQTLYVLKRKSDQNIFF